MSNDPTHLDPAFPPTRDPSLTTRRTAAEPFDPERHANPFDPPEQEPDPIEATRRAVLQQRADWYYLLINPGCGRVPQGGWQGEVNELYRLWHFYLPDRPAPERQRNVEEADEYQDVVDCLLRELNALESPGPTEPPPAREATDGEASAAVMPGSPPAVPAAASPRDPPAGVPLTTADSPTRWAKLFAVSVSTFKRRCGDGRIRCKKLSDRSYQVAIEDLPAKHQAKFQPDKPAAK